MVKFASEGKDTKYFDPISAKTLAQIAIPPPPSPAPADSPPGPPAVSREEGSEEAATRIKTPKKRSSFLKAMRPPKNEKLDRVVKCLLTPSEELELRHLIGSFAEAAETKLTLSHLVRPYFILLRHSAAQLIEEFGRAKPERPINDRTALAYFEHQLAQIVHGALRRAPSYRADRSSEDEP